MLPNFYEGISMNYDVEMEKREVEFGQMPPQQFLLGLLSAFDNRYQAVADRLIGEITWKQFFAIICISICKEPPTLNELSDVMESSHQNVKQILLKLESKGFVSMVQDEKDKRKQRVAVTDKCREFCAKNDDLSRQTVNAIFEGIDEKDLLVTIKTIMQMERNLKNI